MGISSLGGRLGNMLAPFSSLVVSMVIVTSITNSYIVASITVAIIRYSVELYNNCSSVAIVTLTM